MAKLTRASALALVVGLPLAGVTAADTPATATVASPAVDAVTVTVQSGALIHSARGIINLGAHTADLTTHLRDGQVAEVRVVGGRAFVRLGPGAPWLSVDPGKVGTPVPLLWDVAAARAANSRHLSVTVGRKHPVTLTINLSSASAKSQITAPSAAANVTQYLRELRLLMRNN